MRERLRRGGEGVRDLRRCRGGERRSRFGECERDLRVLMGSCFTRLCKDCEGWRSNGRGKEWGCLVKAVAGRRGSAEGAAAAGRLLLHASLWRRIALAGGAGRRPGLLLQLQLVPGEIDGKLGKETTFIFFSFFSFLAFFDFFFFFLCFFTFSPLITLLQMKA